MKTVIEMAREAGICTWLKPPEDVTERLERFAELVRADEREVMLHLAISHGAPWSFLEVIRARRSNT